MSTASDTSVTTQVYRVYIKASPQAIWDAITQPEWTERYGYGGRGVFELKPGGAYVGYTSEAMRAVGSPEVAIDGEVIEVDPPHRLVQTWRMVMDEQLASEGFTRLTYDIAEGKGGVSKLTVTHELEGAPNLAVLMSGGMEDMGAGGGWAWVLSDLKTVLETGAGMDPGDGLNQG
jgi:uncharacterized protein YndB with AHSA1/START domain